MISVGSGSAAVGGWHPARRLAIGASLRGLPTRAQVNLPHILNCEHLNLMQSPPRTPAEARKHGRLSRRHRRLLWSAGALALGSLLAVALAANYYRGHQPRIYKPGEDLADITHVLEHDTASATTPASSGRSPSGSLRKLDRQLPAGAPEPRFTDVTEQAGLAQFRSFAGNRTSQLPEDMVRASLGAILTMTVTMTCSS